MPRSNRPKRKRQEETPELNLDAVRVGIKRIEVKNGIEFVVQTTMFLNTFANTVETKICKVRYVRTQTPSTPST